MQKRQRAKYSQYKLASSLDIRPYYKPAVTKRLALTQKRQVYKWNRIESLGKNSHISRQMIYNKSSEEWKVFSDILTKKLILDPLPHTIHEINVRYIIVLNMKVKYKTSIGDTFMIFE